MWVNVMGTLLCWSLMPSGWLRMVTNSTSVEMAWGLQIILM